MSELSPRMRDARSAVEAALTRKRATRRVNEHHSMACVRDAPTIESTPARGLSQPQHEASAVDTASARRQARTA